MKSWVGEVMWYGVNITAVVSPMFMATASVMMFTLSEIRLMSFVTTELMMTMTYSLTLVVSAMVIVPFVVSRYRDGDGFDELVW